MTRYPNEEVSVDLSKERESPDGDAIKQVVVKIYSSPNCRKFEDNGVVLFNVKSFLNSRSVSELVENLKAFSQQAGSETATSSSLSDVSDVQNDWFITESQSPIDEGPRVTIIKVSEDENHTLVLRCNEDKTVAYLKTDDKNR